MPRPPRFNVLGVGVHATNLEHAADRIVAAAQSTDGPHRVCFCDVNSISCAQRDPAHRDALNTAFLATPDGMPIVWFGRRAGHVHTGRAYGPDMLERIAALTAGSELRHFFCGGTDGVARELAEKLSARFPGLKIASTFTPPFGPWSVEQRAQLQTLLRETRPHFLWIGLSTPKQEAFMAEWSTLADVPVMLGVGAAFDFLTGRVRQAPRWIQRSGFEWLWRLSREPRRLGPRYLRNNPLFVWRILLQLSGLRRYDQPWLKDNAPD